MRPRVARRGLWLSTAVLVLAAIGGVLLSRLTPELPAQKSDSSASGSRPADRNAVGVIYFLNSVDPSDSDHLGRMLTSLLFTELARRPDLDVVSQQRLYGAAANLGGIVVGDRSRAAEIGRLLALDEIVLGEVTKGDTLVATVEVVDVGSGRVLSTHRAQGRHPSDLFNIAASLGLQVSESLIAVPTDLAKVVPSTVSVDAYRAYVIGEELLHRHDFAGSMEKFGESVAIDPNFALAHYRLGLAAAWQGNDDVALSASSQALNLAEDLPSLQRDLFEAMVLFHRGRYSEALPLVESLLVDDPESKEALYLVSEIYLHSGLDTHLARATEAMLILESLDPSFTLLYNHLALALVIQDRWEEAFVHLDRWVARDPELANLRPVMVGIGGRVEEVPELQGILSRVNMNYSIALAILRDQWGLAREMTTTDWGEGYQHSWFLRSRGGFLTYRGQFEAARKAYLDATSKHAEPDHEGIQNGFPWSAFRGLAQLDELRGELKQARSHAEAGVRLHPLVPAPRFLAGRLAALDGDVAASEEQLSVVRGMAATSHGSMAVLFEQALEAEILLLEGRAEQARTKYERVVGSGTLLHDFYAAASSSGAEIRDGLARACRALWDRACEIEALGGLLDSGFERVDHPVLYVRALFRLGELHLEAGEVELAREYFDRFLEHWGTADWVLSEVVEAHRHVTERSAVDTTSRASVPEFS